MSLLSRLASAMGIYADAREAKMTSRELAEMIAGRGMSGSGAPVNWSTALQVTTVLTCARVIAEGCSQVPFKLFQGGAERREALDHPLHDLLYRRPNPWQTAFEFRETMVFHLVLTGNAYVRKLRVGSARQIGSLELCDPQRTRVLIQQDGTLRYFYTPLQGGELEIDAADMWHVRGPSWNTYLGLDVVKLAAEAIGLSIATEAAHADLHRNGARISGFYSFDGNITEEQHAKLDGWLAKYSQGGERAGKPGILDRGAKFQNMTMTGVDAEHLATRKYQSEEICRAMRVMPIMAGIPGAAGAYDNGESMFIAHVVHTLMPWYERIEHSADVNLLTFQDRAAGFYTKFNPNALMRGSSEARGKYFAQALGAGGQRPWMKQDEVRASEELSPYGGHADELGTGAMDKQAAPAPVTGA